MSAHPPAPARPTRPVDELVEQSSSAREELWQSLGTLEPFALSQNGSNSLVTGHRWPSLKQNFRVIHRPNGNVMVVSDGLSDPFDDIHEGEEKGRGRGNGGERGMEGGATQRGGKRDREGEGRKRGGEPEELRGNTREGEAPHDNTTQS